MNLKMSFVRLAFCGFLSVTTASSSFAQQENPLLPPGFGGALQPQRQQDAPRDSEGLPPPGQMGGGSARLPGDDVFGDLGGAFVPVESPAEVEAGIRKNAFDAAVSGMLPMKPAEIRKLLEYYDQTKQAVEVPIYPYPKPEVSVITLSLDPGVLPPEIKLAPGHVSSLSMLDITGAPWPIQDISWAGNFEIIHAGEGEHMVRITPMSDFAYGNLSMRLNTLKTPVTFILRVNRETVHYRLDARLPEFGPFASAPLIEGGLSTVAGGGDLTAILDGTPPQTARKLEVTGVDGRTTAYRYGARTYVRTPLTLLSPGWEESVSSADGMSVYALANTPVLVLSDRGQMVRARIKQEDAPDGQ